MREQKRRSRKSLEVRAEEHPCKQAFVILIQTTVFPAYFLCYMSVFVCYYYAMNVCCYHAFAGVCLISGEGI
jgi:hypothetical protein